MMFKEVHKKPAWLENTNSPETKQTTYNSTTTKTNRKETEKGKTDPLEKANH